MSNGDTVDDLKAAENFYVANISKLHPISTHIRPEGLLTVIQYHVQPFISNRQRLTNGRPKVIDIAIMKDYRITPLLMTLSDL